MLYALRALSLCMIAIAVVAPSGASAASGPEDLQTASRSVRPSFAVLLTRGDASENERAYADAAIVKALRGHGFVADLLSDPAGDLAILGPAICATTGAQFLLGGTVSIGVQPDREINQWATAKLDLAAYDCAAGRSLRVNSGSAATYNWNWAVDQAVAVALKPLIRE